MKTQIKIGIITILKVNNYGAELQAYALQKKLQNLGYNAEIIDYLFYKHPKHRKTKKSRPVIPLDFIKSIKEFVYPIMASIIRIFNYNVEKKRNRKFELFHTQYTRLSKEFRTIEDLENYPFDYDVYIVGSDQVWNPYSNSSVLPYFLHFAPSDKIKLSYASSFGVSKLPDNIKNIYAYYLDRFDFLSVRENIGMEIIQSLIKKEVQHVLDPTLLLTKEDWRNIAVTPPENTPYILLYELSPMPYIKDLAIQIQQQTGWNIIRVYKDAGPLEFIGLFFNAHFVITNSFHGTAFAINFQKPFYSVISSAKNNNSRLVSILKILHLENRLLRVEQNFPNFDLTIDWEDVNEILDKERTKSITFIIDSINLKNNTE
jgi:hypothetical protein